jgi:hypothetical protein
MSDHDCRQSRSDPTTFYVIYGSRRRKYHLAELDGFLDKSALLTARPMFAKHLANHSFNRARELYAATMSYARFCTLHGETAQLVAAANLSLEEQKAAWEQSFVRYERYLIEKSIDVKHHLRPARRALEAFHRANFAVPTMELYKRAKNTRLQKVQKSISVRLSGLEPILHTVQQLEGLCRALRHSHHESARELIRTRAASPHTRSFVSLSDLIAEVTALQQESAPDDAFNTGDRSLKEDKQAGKQGEA